MDSVEAVEKILNYSSTDKNLLKEAITQTSCSCIESSALFERLEFLGDSVLELAFTNYIHLVNPNLNLKELHKIRHANVSNENFARVAVNHNLHQCLIFEDPNPYIDKKIKDFSEAVAEEDDPAPYGGLVKAPKILADLVESIAGAVYIDVNFDLQRVWEIFRRLVEPIYTLDHLRQKPQQTFIRLFRLGDKLRKRIDFMYSKDHNNSNVFEVYLGDKFTGCGRANNIECAKLVAANERFEALRKLSKCMPIENIVDEDNLDVEMEDVKRKSFESCCWEINPVFPSDQTNRK